MAIFATAAFGQANRMVLIEEFTGENCAPCASVNPGFDAIVKANPTTAVMLKHQVPIPSAGPIYLGWTTDADARRSYYGVSSAPNGRMDGGDLAPGTSSPTYPGFFTQAHLNTRSAVTSSFSMSTSHTLSNDLDSIFVTITVQNVDGFTVNSLQAGSLRLHVAVIEEEMQFASAPGTNGETEFYHVNRKMYPSAAGTQMADSWTAQQSQTFTIAAELPMHIYNYNEVAVVAYIQDNGDKSVHNASFSAAVPAPANIPDMTIYSSISGGGDLCAGTFTPEFEIENLSTATCTSADVEYRINGGAWTTQAWTGSLGQNQKATVSFASASLPFATNNIEARVVNPNGSRDVNSLNNEITPVTLNVLSPIVAPTPYTVTFENSSLGQTPSNLILNDNSGRVFTVDQGISSAVTWPLGAYEASNRSYRFDFYTIDAGTVSELIMQKVDISSTPNAKIFFNHAFQQYNTQNDGLAVYVSDDCGQNWTKVWDRSGASLVTTANPSSTARLYPRANDWTSNVAQIPGSMQNANELIVKFVGTSDYGNALYVDNIVINSNAVGEEENVLEEAVIFPNPADRVAELRFTAIESGEINVTVLDLNGRAVSLASQNVSAGVQSIELDVADLPTGVYMVKVQQNDDIKTLRLSVTH